MKSNACIRCSVVGYGAYHNFGRAHGRWIDAVPELQWVAVCDKDPSRLSAAREEFPTLDTYDELDDMLSRGDVDLVSIVTPHATHAPIALQCMAAGKHVVVDKAMCLTVAEATAMMEAMPAMREKGAAKHHVGRFGDPEHDAGEAAAWLVSGRSSFVTGTTLFVDGGMCL